MLTYSTRQGDVVDDIVYRHYGALNPAMLRLVFEANSGLADRGAVLPAGVVIALPEIQQPAATTTTVSLWD